MPTRWRYASPEILSGSHCAYPQILLGNYHCYRAILLGHSIVLPHVL
jgi:hypothetical protein